MSPLCFAHTGSGGLISVHVVCHSDHRAHEFSHALTSGFSSVAVVFVAVVS